MCVCMRIGSYTPIYLLFFSRSGFSFVLQLACNALFYSTSCWFGFEKINENWMRFNCLLRWILMATLCIYNKLIDIWFRSMPFHDLMQVCFALYVFVCEFLDRMHGMRFVRFIFNQTGIDFIYFRDSLYRKK